MAASSAFSAASVEISFVNCTDPIIASGIKDATPAIIEKTIKVAIEGTKSVSDLFGRLEQITGVPRSHLRLKGFKRRPVKFDFFTYMTVEHYPVRGKWKKLSSENRSLAEITQTYTKFQMTINACNDLLHCTKAPLTLKFLTGKCIQLYVDASTTMADVLQQCQDQTGIPPDVIRLVHKGKHIFLPFTQDKPIKLVELGISGSSPLYCVLRLPKSTPLQRYATI
jgi:hypothetical protein